MALTLPLLIYLAVLVLLLASAYWNKKETFLHFIHFYKVLSLREGGGELIVTESLLMLC